jgi:hypothetical protein
MAPNPIQLALTAIVLALATACSPRDEPTGAPGTTMSGTNSSPGTSGGGSPASPPASAASN